MYTSGKMQFEGINYFPETSGSAGEVGGGGGLLELVLGGCVLPRPPNVDPF